MTDVALDLPPDLDAQVPFDALVVCNAGVDDKLEILVGMFSFRSSVSNSGDSSLLHIWFHLR